jgi:hypothetical protein
MCLGTFVLKGLLFDVDVTDVCKKPSLGVDLMAFVMTEGHAGLGSKCMTERLSGWSLKKYPYKSTSMPKIWIIYRRVFSMSCKRLQY